MLKVGINDNLVLTAVDANIKDDDTSRIELTFKELTAKHLDLFEALATGQETATGNDLGMTLKVWCPKEPKELNMKKETRTFAERSKEAVQSVQELLNTCSQLLGCYMPKDQMAFRPYEGIADITVMNYESKLMDGAILKTIFVNLANQLAIQIAPFLNDGNTPVRLILIRQSEAKHYPIIRDRWVKDNPFIELCAIPLEQTKLKFTKREIEKKLNDGTVVSSDAADPVSQEIPSHIGNLFGDSTPAAPNPEVTGAPAAVTGAVEVGDILK